MIRRATFVLLGVLAAAIAAFCIWFFSQKATGKRDWDVPFQRMPVSTFSADGRFVTIENVRDFHYRSEQDYDVRYRTETYDLDALETLDFSITHWNGSEMFGHIMLSFGFSDGRYFVFSPEARLTKGHRYEILPGFLRQYELIFIVATEEDAIQLRTHHRRYERSEVLLYPTTFPPSHARAMLTDLLKRANGLRKHPEFYNGLTYNCLTSMKPTMEKLGRTSGRTWHGIVNGLADRAGWKRGWMKRSKNDVDFETFRRRHSVNQYVEHLVDPPDFSQLIRPDRPKEKE